MVSSDEIERETERDRGILSGPDRKWLLMDRDEYVEEHSRQYWGQRRDKVKNRIRHAMLDFSLLFDHLDDDIRMDISYRSASTFRDDQKYADGVRDGFAFLLEVSGGNRLLMNRDLPLNADFPDIFEGTWERIAWRSRYRLHNWELNVEGEPIPWRELQERAKAGEELTVEEQAQLLLALGDDVDPGESQKLLNALLFDEDGVDEMPTTGDIYDATKE